MSIEENIKQWVILDNQSRVLYEQLKETRDKKSELVTEIMTYFSAKNIKSPTINISDGRLSIAETRQANAITLKFLDICLDEYFQNKQGAKDLVDFIKSKRTYTTATNIRRTYNEK